MIQNETSEPVMMMRVRHFSCAVTAGYIHAFKAMMETDDARFVLDFDEVDLIERRAWLVPAVVRSTDNAAYVVGGFHFVIDGMRTAHVQGVALDPVHRRGGLMKRLLAETFASLFELDAVDAIELEVRVLPDGSVNEKAFRLFSSLGLNPTGVETALISGTRIDCHLYGTAEPDGKSFRYLRMRRQLADLVPATKI